jgi:feruloyl esterase
MRFMLPERSAWNGKLMASAGAGSQGQVESLNAHFAAGIAFGAQMPLYAIQLGYVGSYTDAGHLAGEEFGVIQATHSLKIGKLTDWGGRASTDTTRWAKIIAKTYYGSRVTRSYWNGCSGGGLQGLTQMQQNGKEYDAFLIGAPPYAWARWMEQTKWASVVVKDMLTPLGKSLTQSQIAAANQGAAAACHAGDVTHGLWADPRACKRKGGLSMGAYGLELYLAERDDTDVCRRNATRLQSGRRHHRHQRRGPSRG